MDRLLPLWDSSELAVIILEWFVCVEEDETSDASCQSLSSIDVESLVDARDSPIPTSMMPAVNLQNYPAGKTEV